MFRLAEMFVEIKAQDSALQAQMGGIQRQLGTFGVAVGSAIGNLAAGAITQATSAIGGFFARGVSGAMELEDSLSAVSVIFGDSAKTITGMADEMASKFGVVKGEFINAASAFGSAFKGAGASQADAANAGNSLAKLGMDLASFTAGATNQEAFTALQAALRGEFDPLERFNVFLSAAKIEQEALSSGLAKTSKEIDDQAKKQATFNLIMKMTADQQGDLERTADSPKNAWAKLTGTLSNAATVMGQILIPSIGGVMAYGQRMADTLAPAIEGLRPYVEGFASAFGSLFNTMVTGWASLFSYLAEAPGIIVAAIGPTAIAVVTQFGGAIKSWILDKIDLFAFAWRNMGDVFKIGAIKIYESIINIGEYLATVPANLSLIAQYVQNNWRQLMADGINAVGAMFRNLGENIKNLFTAVKDWFDGKGFNFKWTPLLDGFKATAEQFPEMMKPKLTSLQAEIDTKLQEIARREADRNRQLQEKAKQDGEKSAIAKDGEAAAQQATTQEKKFQSETVDTADFSRRLRASIFGADDTQRGQLEALREIMENTRKMAQQKLAAHVAVLG